MPTVRLLLTAAFVLLSAISASANVPAPKEFEQAAPPAPAGVAAGHGFVSEPLRAPGRFNLVGLSWRGSGEPEIAIRARTGEGAWTRWTPATGHHSRGTSDPVFVGEAEWVQYRLSHKVPRLRLHFVDTIATGRALAARARGSARAAASGPKIRPRSARGAKYCPTRGVSYGSVRAAIVHHTVTANEYTKAHVPAAILAVCRFHRNTNGWADIGYNFVVDRFGRIWEGRAGGIDEAVVGAQAQGYNSQTTGIANLGTFSAVPQSDRAVGAIARLARWKLASHGVRSNGKTTLTSAGGPAARYPAGVSRSFNRISGHRDTGITECPGEQLYRQLPEVRERVGERLHPGAPLTVEAPFPELVTYAPEGVAFGGRVIDANAFPVEGLTFELQTLLRTGWSTLASAFTQSDGTFSATAPLAANTVLRWKYAGDETWRPHRGDGALVGVAPAISLASSATTVEPGEAVQLTGSVDPAKSAGVVLVAELHEGGDVWTRVWRKKLKPRDGQIARQKAFDEEGDYRFWVYFAGDAVNTEAVSAHVPLRVETSIFPFR